MIIGISMGLEICLILGQVSLNLLLLEEKLPDGFLWSGGVIDEKTAYIQARSAMARVMEVNGKECQAQGKAKMVGRKDSS